MTFNDMINRRNIDDKIYRGDLREWLGIDIPANKFNELIDKFSELPREQ